MRGLLVAISIAALSINSFASDSDRISLLEREVQELKIRLMKLETPQVGTNNPQRITPSSEGWRVIANWRALKKGMSYENVKALLGEPERVNGGNFTQWNYSNQGTVTFFKDSLYGWTEP